MPQIKTTLNTQTRITTNTSFQEYISNIRALFSLPLNWNFKGTYIDKDNDVITIDSEQEFNDLVGSGNPIKIDISENQRVNEFVALINRCNGNRNCRPFNQSKPESINGVTFWKSVTCDGCRIKGIIGKRFKCVTCPDYDLCSECIQKNDHEHEFEDVEVVDPESVLNGMGFFDQELNRDLIERYQGNVERVVEVLTQH